MRVIQGYSLIELMISLTLGLLITAAASQILIGNQMTLNFQRGMNDVQANGRFAIDQMVRDIRIAGLDSAAVSSGAGKQIKPVAFAVADIPGLPAASTHISSDGMQTTTDITGLLTNSDQLVLQHLAVAAGTDCEGNATVAGRYVIARYYIRLDSGVPALFCDGGSHNGTTLDATPLYGDDGLALVTGVDSFQVMYGIDDSVAGTAQPVRYVTAATYAGLVPQPQILAVRLGLYMHSQAQAGQVDKPAAAIQVLDTSVAAASVPDDDRLRRLFVTTAGLRNVSLGGI